MYAFCFRTKATHRTKNTLLLHLYHQININNTIVISFTYFKCEYFSLSSLHTMEGWYIFLDCNFLITACNLKPSLSMVTMCQQCHEHVTINLCHFYDISSVPSNITVFSLKPDVRRKRRSYGVRSNGLSRRKQRLNRSLDDLLRIANNNVRHEL